MSRALGPRLWALVDSGVALAEETSLEGLLERVVGLAAELTGARRATLGLLAPDGASLERIVTAGGGDADPGPVGPARDDDATGTSLDTPVLVNGTPYGHLHLAGKTGGAPFTDEDRECVRALARQAGAAIRGRLVHESERAQAAQLDVMREVTDGLVAGAGATDLLSLVVRHFRGLVDADAAGLGLFGDDGAYRVVVAEGKGADFLLAAGPELPPQLVDALATGACVRLDSVTDEPGVNPDVVRAAGVGSALLAPLKPDGRLLGVLGAADKRGGLRFTGSDERVAEVFAHRAAAVLELSQRVTRRSVRTILQAQEDERRRLGRELHDQTGQELTAALLALRRIDRLIGDAPEAHREVAALRALIAGSLRGVRLMSSMLAPPVFEEDDLGDALEALASLLGERGGLRIDVEAVGGQVRGAQAATLYRIAQESLTNVVRHAGANRARIRVASDERAVRMTVSDDGVGFEPQASSGVGLSGMRERARLLGGALTVNSGPGRGSVVTAELPLP